MGRVLKCREGDHPSHGGRVTPPPAEQAVLLVAIDQEPGCLGKRELLIVDWKEKARTASDKSNQRTSRVKGWFTHLLVSVLDGIATAYGETTRCHLSGGTGTLPIHARFTHHYFAVHSK